MLSATRLAEKARSTKMIHTSPHATRRWILIIALVSAGFSGLGGLFIPAAAASEGTGSADLPSNSIRIYLPISKVEEGSLPPPPGPGELPYGPFHNSNFDRTFFNGAILAAGEWRDMANARAHGYQVLGSTADSNPCDYMPNGPDSFDVDALMNYILGQRDNILEYAGDGTLMGIIELNEPHDPNCEEHGGQDWWTVPQWALYETAQRFWEAFPELSPATFYFGFGTPPTYIEAGGGSPDINLAFIQFSPNDGLIHEWAPEFQESAARQNMRLVYSANLDLLGLGPTVAANIWECQQSDAILVTLWRDMVIDDADGNSFEQARHACASGSP
jgi:hypothetical protein